MFYKYHTDGSLEVHNTVEHFGKLEDLLAERDKMMKSLGGKPKDNIKFRDDADDTMTKHSKQLPKSVKQVEKSEPMQKVVAQSKSNNSTSDILSKLNQINNNINKIRNTLSSEKVFNNVKGDLNEVSEIVKDLKLSL